MCQHFYKKTFFILLDRSNLMCYNVSINRRGNTPWNTTTTRISPPRAAHAALETALDAMTALTDKGHFDYALIHDMTARRDALRWRIGASVGRLRRQGIPTPKKEGAAPSFFISKK